jgi:hypothetical protein
MGVDKDIKGKADRDYDKRTADVPADERKQAVFVFVTPRTWQKKDEWEEAKRATGDWRDVKVLDANDLEHWLEIAPAVDVWLAKLTGRATDGVQDLQSYWNAVRSLAEHPLTPSVFTASREPEIGAVRQWLAGQPSSLFMKTYGLADGIDFLAALSAGDQNEKLQSALIVYTPEAWRHLTASREPLVLIAAPTLELQASDTAAAVSAGHHVYVSGPRGIAGQGSGDTLRRQDHLSITEALRESGFSDARAMSLGIACCGSSSILKRLITRHPETRFPAWSRDDVRSTLAPFALIGGWAHVDPEPPKEPRPFGLGAASPLDLWLMSELVACTREQVTATVARWERDSEPLFLRFRSTVFVLSREDAWHLLGGSVSEEHLRRFRDLSLLVLQEDNPAFELAPDQRWLANLYGKTHSLSQELRTSIIETLALMAIYPTADRPAASVDFRAAVQWVLDQVLPRHASWQRWASFGNNLTILAEADPQLFLSRAEEDLASPDPELPKLFQDQSDSFFTGAIHSDLLWALEGLAWSSEYIRRVAVILAKLAARDPGGRYANRPAKSLNEIFLWWLWHTNASVDDRITALTEVVRAEPEVGWKLLAEILPSGRPGFSQNAHMPRWRSWADGWSRAKLQPQIPEYATRLAELTLGLAGTDPRRWAQVLDGMLRITRDMTNRVFRALEAICDLPGKDPEATFALWQELREIASRHERHSDAGWALPRELRGRVAAIRDRLQPSDPVLAHQWLFAQHVELPGIDMLRNYEAHQQALYEARLEALRQIVSSGGPQGIFRLLGLAKDTANIGWIIGQQQLLSPNDVQLPTILDTTDNNRLAFIHYYVLCRFNREAWDFVNGLPVSQWQPTQAAAIARCLPFRPDVWRWVHELGSAVEDDYWRRVRGFLHQPNVEQVQTACRSLIGAGRPFSAIDVLHAAQFDKLALPSELLAEVLESAFTVDSSNDLAAARNIQYDVQQLIKHLQNDKGFDRTRLARIEWAFLELLDRESSDVGPDTLIQAVLSEPDFFVQLLCFAYRGEKDPPREARLPPEERLRARHAQTLLNRLSKLPGTNEQGVADCNIFRPWIERVRSRATECDRLPICDETLGEVFGRSTRRPDGNWPPPELAAVAEAVGSDDFFAGFINGLLNSRGVVSRGLWEGGVQERALADRYRQLAEHARPSSPKLAAAFLRLADIQESDARREDEEAERSRLGR